MLIDNDIRCCIERSFAIVDRYPTFVFSVFQWESVRIAFTYAALNGLDVCAADIRNAYLQAPSSCKHYVICGPEFGLENVGKVALIHRALYGGKTAGRDYRNHLRSCILHLDFRSCPADPDVLIRQFEDSGAATMDALGGLNGFWEHF